MIEGQRDRRSGYRIVLDEVQAHYGVVEAIVAAAIAAASAAAAQASQNKANRAKRRAQGNANQMGSQGQMDVSAPTALRFADDKGAVSPTRAAPTQGQGDSSLPQIPQGVRVSELLGGATKPATEPQQGQSLGMKSLSDDTPKPITDKNPYSEMPKTEMVNSGSTTAGDVAGYGEQALQLYMMYDQMRNANRPEPQPAAQLGQMSLQPTANRFGV